MALDRKEQIDPSKRLRLDELMVTVVGTLMGVMVKTDMVDVMVTAAVAVEMVAKSSVTEENNPKNYLIELLEALIERSFQQKMNFEMCLNNFPDNEKDN